MKGPAKTSSLVAAVFILQMGSARGAIVQHLGSIDPRQEGFKLNIPGNAQLVPVTGDFGLDAWSIDVNSGNEFGFYTYDLTSQERQAAESLGWTMSVRLRMAEAPDSGGAMLARFFTGTHLFSLYFGAESDGDPFVRIGSSGQGPTYVLQGSGGGYHLYVLSYDAVSSLASLSIDGVERFSDLPGIGLGTEPRVDFGGGQGVTHANWNEFTLYAVPEPAAAAFVILGMTLITGRRAWRRGTSRATAAAKERVERPYRNLINPI